MTVLKSRGRFCLLQVNDLAHLSKADKNNTGLAKADSQVTDGMG